MNLTPIIDRLKGANTVFGQNVFGHIGRIPDFSPSYLNPENYPACYVCSVAEYAGEGTSMGDIRIEDTSVVQLVCVFQAVEDGIPNLAGADDVKNQIFQVLAGWNISKPYTPMLYQSTEYGISRETFVMQMQFSYARYYVLEVDESTTPFLSAHTQDLIINMEEN